MDKLQKLLLVVPLSLSLGACVTQQYGKDNTPVIENEASNDEIAMTRISLGLGYLNIGNTTQAKTNLEKAKRYSPRLVQVHTAFAHYYETVGEPELARKSFLTAIDIKEDDPDTLNNYGVFLCRQGDIEGAQEQFLNAIAVPEYVRVSESYENLALCHLDAGNFEEAEMYLAKAIMHSPSSASALQQMAQLTYAKSDYQQAQNYISRYEKATRKFSPSALALSYKVYERQGKIDIAKNYGAMLVKMYPNAYESKQYLLNGLSRIEADNLADEYQKQQQKDKKRVIVLSPKKAKKKIANTEQVFDESLIASFDEPAQTAVETNTKKTEQTKSMVVTKPAEIAEEDVKPVVVEKAVKSETPETLPVASGNVSVPVHVVQQGESLYSISLKYNLKMRTLQRWNKLSSRSVLKIGQVLVLADPNPSSK